MRKHIAILFVAINVLSAYGVFAQTSVITTTNVVIVTVTNIVTITNILTKPLAAPVSSPSGQPPKYPWESSITAGLTLTRGNSSTLLVTGGAQTHKKTPANEITFGADGAYGVNNSVKDVDTIHGSGQYNHLFSDRFYGYARAEGLHDGVANLQYRVTIGPGAGYYLIKETNTTFAVELGSSFVNQRLGDVDDNYATLRLAERFEHKFTGYNARLWENVEVLPQVDKLDNYIMNGEIGIESAISKSVSLKTFLVDNFNNQPAAGREKNDVKLVSGITYKF
jgi:putative salt-induced outer membrane protein YdiY